ncbi:MAG: type II toxin-antitoxin system PemK/MazF family toxin [Cellulosilyticaceae bacterium]
MSIAAVNRVVDFNEVQKGKQPEVMPGDVVYVELKGEGSVQRGFRPSVVVSNEKGCKFSPTLTVVPLTSKVKKYIPTHVALGKNIGLHTDSIALCESITTVDRKQIKNGLICSIPMSKMKEIKAAMAIALGMDE